MFIKKVNENFRPNEQPKKACPVSSQTPCMVNYDKEMFSTSDKYKDGPPEGFVKLTVLCSKTLKKNVIMTFNFKVFKWIIFVRTMKRSLKTYNTSYWCHRILDSAPDGGTQTYSVSKSIQRGK